MHHGLQGRVEGWVCGRLTLPHQQAHAVWSEHTLEHGETLLVVSARDAEAVALELVTEGVAGNLLGDPLVEERQAVRGLSQRVSSPDKG